jgi:glycosyltransferase involved in cell wall biosynthesis
MGFPCLWLANQIGIALMPSSVISPSSISKLFIIIPAYNEEANIAAVAREWHEVVAKINTESRLVIIDDGSRDNTYKLLNGLKTELSQLTVLTKPNSGHGATVLFGYSYALSNGADYIFQTDSDGQTLPSEFGQFWENRDNYSAIIGYRNHREDGLSRIVVTKVLKFVLWAVFGLNITDANTPFRLMKREILQKYIGKIPSNYNLTNVMLTVYLTEFNENVKFIPITFRERQGGKNSVNLKKIIKIGTQAIKDFRELKKRLYV